MTGAQMVWATVVVIVAVLIATSFDAWIKARYPHYKLRDGETGDEAHGTDFGVCINAIASLSKLREQRKNQGGEGREG